MQFPRVRYWVLFVLSCLLGLPLCSVAADYQLGPGDTLRVTVNGYDIGVLAVVGADGTIHLPVIGDIAAQGLTVSGLEQSLSRAFKKRILNPEVFVSLTAQHNAQVYIAGAVNTLASTHTRQGWACWN